MSTNPTTVQKTAREGHVTPDRPAVLLIGDDSRASDLESLKEEIELLQATTLAEAEHCFEGHALSVVVVAPPFSGQQARELLDHLERRFPGMRPLNLVLSAGSDPEIFQERVDRDGVFYLTSKPLGPTDSAALVRAAAKRAVSGTTTGSELEIEESSRALRVRRVLDLARRVSLQRDLASASLLTGETLRELIGAERGYCLIHDVAEDTLWSKDTRGGEMRRQAAASGLVSYAARTGAALSIDAAAGDARYDREADDPVGAGDERLLIEPVTTVEGPVIGVLVAVRSHGSSAFSADEVAMLRLFAKQLVHPLQQLSLQARIAGFFATQERAARVGAENPYRDEAYEHHVSRGTSKGDVLRLLPSPMRWGYWALLALTVAAFAGGAIARVDEYAIGPAYVTRADGAVQIVAVLPGHYRPQLAVGMPLRFALSGYSHSAQVATLESIDPQLLTPEELGRRIGLFAASRGPSAEPVMLLRATLSAQTFVAGERAYPYFTGMGGQAELRIRSERLLLTLFPMLSSALGATGG